MKLEPVLTIKIVDNFVRFGMPYALASFPGLHSLVPRLSWNANMYQPRSQALLERKYISTPAQLQCSRSRAWEPGNEAKAFNHLTRQVIGRPGNEARMHSRLCKVASFPAFYACSSFLKLNWSSQLGLANDIKKKRENYVQNHEWIKFGTTMLMLLEVQE